MRQLLVIGIGAGNPEYVTVQAIKALNMADVFFIIDKGDAKGDLIRLRKEICSRYIDDPSYRFVAAPDPERDRAPASYQTAVEDWHHDRTLIYETMIANELSEDECGAFLVWGDPSLYDSTLRIIEQVVQRGGVLFEYEVIPGITSVQVLAAKHKTVLNRIGESIQITTGRHLADGLNGPLDNVVVMLDRGCSFNSVTDDDIDIYWGAYLGTADEILISGKLKDAKSEIERVRAAARKKHGWIMDTYLLRRNNGQGPSVSEASRPPSHPADGRTSR
jgi:precorrin-6A synthase